MALARPSPGLERSGVSVCADSSVCASSVDPAMAVTTERHVVVDVTAMAGVRRVSREDNDEIRVEHVAGTDP